MSKESGYVQIEYTDNDLLDDDLPVENEMIPGQIANQKRENAQVTKVYNSKKKCLSLMVIILT